MDGSLPSPTSAAQVDGRRPIAALEFENLRPNVPPTRAPEFRWVDPRTLLVDETYQRGLSRRSLKLIRSIAEDWDWARFKPPVVANTAGGLEVIDGQHTAIGAATHGGIREIPVMITAAPGVQDRARSFIGHNRDRLQMTYAQLHAAAIAAADPDALAVVRVCDAAGVRLLTCAPPSKYLWKVGESQAYRAIYHLVTDRGPTAAKRILSILVEGGGAPIAEFAIEAVETLLFHPDYAGQVAAEDIVKALRGLGKELKSEAAIFAAAHRVNRSKGAAVVLFKRANRGKHRK
jgi:hypothetical protein